MIDIQWFSKGRTWKPQRSCSFTTSPHQFQPGRLKVKVRSGVWRFQPYTLCPVHIFWTTGKNFKKLWSNVHRINMMCRTYVPTWPAQGRGHQWCLKIWTMHFVSGTYLLNPWKEFHETLVKFCSNLSSSKSRSLVMFQCLNHILRVRSIIAKPLEGISWNFGQMFTPSRRCAEPMSQPCKLKVTVTSGV
jgi:hypothetical protein